MKNILRFVAVLILPVSGFVVWHLFLKLPVVTIDTSVRYQVMRGWELTADYPEKPTDPATFLQYNDLLADLVKRGGIDRLRVEVRSGAETNDEPFKQFFEEGLPYEAWKKHRYPSINDNDDAHKINWEGFDFSELDHHIRKTVLPMRKLLEARGERLVVNVCFVSFGGESPLHRDPEEYGEFVLAAYLYMQKNYGFVPDMWEVLLEPDRDEPKWTGEMIGEAIVAASRRLRENGFEPAFVAPSVTDMNNAVPYMRGIASVPGALKDVVEFSFHPYRHRSQRNLRRIGALGKELNLPTSMLEWWFGKATHSVLHEDLKTANVSAWQGRVVRGFFAGTENGTGPARPFKPDTLFTSVYFRNIRLGAVRVGARSNSIWLNPVAFSNANGGIAVLLLAKRQTRGLVDDLPKGRYKVSYTTPNGSFELATEEIDDGGQIAFSVPEASLVLISSQPVPEP